MLKQLCHLLTLPCPIHPPLAAAAERIRGRQEDKDVTSGCFCGRKWCWHSNKCQIRTLVAKHKLSPQSVGEVPDGDIAMAMQHWDAAIAAWWGSLMPSVYVLGEQEMH